MLISRIMPIMSIYRLPHGQYGYSGHVLNLPHDVPGFINSLPRSPANLDVVVVRKEGAVDTHKDFRVRRSSVLQALRWLVDNNLYYRDVTINQDILASLPIDSLLTEIQTITVSSSEVDMPAQMMKTLIVHTFPVHFFPCHKEVSQRMKLFNSLSFKGIIM